MFYLYCQQSCVPDLKIRTYENQGQTFKDLVQQKRLHLQRRVADVVEEYRLVPVVVAARVDEPHPLGHLRRSPKVSIPSSEVQ